MNVKTPEQAPASDHTHNSTDSNMKDVCRWVADKAESIAESSDDGRVCLRCAEKFTPTGRRRGNYCKRCREWYQKNHELKP